MKIVISFQHLKHSPAVNRRIEEKSKKLEKFLDGKIHIVWRCRQEDGQYCADADLKGPHFEYHATGRSSNLYKAVDLTLEKIKRQLTRRKEKIRNNKIHHPERKLNCLDPELAWIEHEDDQNKAA